ncbi:MAG: ABC transporter ATP-binding protein [Firmicutes bacterium]|nr:ABC transporter ATP-binding protein [Bacillota bacterium]
MSDAHASPAATPVVELIDVSKRYPGEERFALFDVNLEIHAGEFVAILGPSGAGKSTLLNILGLVDRPTGGKVAVYGKAVDHLQEDERAAVRHSYLGFIFQFHYLLPDLTVLENLLLPLLINTPKSQEKTSPVTKVHDMLKNVGLMAKVNHYPHTLSGGERQRIAAARALITGPALILADEPTGNLDTANADLVWELLLQTNQLHNTAVVAITHNEKLANSAKRVINLIDGRLGSL